MSSDGLRVAIGSPGWQVVEYGNDRGQVRIFDYNGSAWVQVGADILGKTGGDNFGDSVALSSDGSKVAIGGRWLLLQIFIPVIEEDMLESMNYSLEIGHS